MEGDPRQLADLPGDAQVAELIGLAARKGKLGSVPGQMSEAQIRGLSPENRARAFAKLADYPDAEPEGDEQADEDPIRF